MPNHCAPQVFHFCHSRLLFHLRFSLFSYPRLLFSSRFFPLTYLGLLFCPRPLFSRKENLLKNINSTLNFAMKRSHDTNKKTEKEVCIKNLIAVHCNLYCTHLRKIQRNTKKVVFKQDMVYMNLEGNWSLATPLTGLGCA